MYYILLFLKKLILTRVTIFVIGIITVALLAIKEDNKKAKVILFYIIGMVLFFTVIIYRKVPFYLCVYTPYLFLSIAFFFAWRYSSIKRINP